MYVYIGILGFNLIIKSEVTRRVRCCVILGWWAGRPRAEHHSSNRPAVLRTGRAAHRSAFFKPPSVPSLNLALYFEVQHVGVGVIFCHFQSFPFWCNQPAVNKDQPVSFLSAPAASQIIREENENPPWIHKRLCGCERIHPTWWLATPLCLQWSNW